LVSSFGAGVRYLSKYLVKGTSARLAGKKGIRGLAMCWIFRKRSFSVSGLLFKRARGTSSASYDAIWHNGISINILSCSPVFECKSPVSELSLNYLDNSDGVFVKTGVDLFGFSTYKRCSRWRLFGFCMSFKVLWDDWRLHFVRFADLKLDRENPFNIWRSYYDVVF